MYKEASKQKLRVQTNRGCLSIEQLWDLSLAELDALAVTLEEEYKDSKGKSFLDKKSKKDKTLKLQFDIIKYAKKQREEFGKHVPAGWISIAIFFIIPALTFLIGGVTLNFQYPDRLLK